jgi:uncharacterized membrane protein YidH (DUF202 family)
LHINFFLKQSKKNKMKNFPIILTLILGLIFTITLITLVINDANRMQNEIHKLYLESIIDGTSKVCDNSVDFTILK